MIKWGMAIQSAKELRAIVLLQADSITKTPVGYATDYDANGTIFK